MEILSTGEKIKRARVYKGITLKDLCGDKISISKMSCIENGKIKADNSSLKYIAEQLKIDYNYLLKDVYEQVVEILEIVENDSISYEEKENILKYSLEYTKLYCYDDLSFDIIHRLFKEYLDRDNLEEIQGLLAEYSEINKKYKSPDKDIIYKEDMARFFMKMKEYTEAINYFAIVREELEKKHNFDRGHYGIICFNEGLCYRKMNQIEKSYEIFEKGINHTEDGNIENLLGGYFNQFALVSIILNKEEADIYVNKSKEYFKDKPYELARSKAKIAECYFKVSKEDRAMMELEEALNIFPKDKIEEYADFIIECIEVLYCNRIYEKVFELTDEALNLAITIDNGKLIEKAYYYKGMTMQRKNLVSSAEMYMNLATDSLSKFGTRQQLYKRYNEMGELYHRLGDIKQASEYFILAIKLEKLL